MATNRADQAQASARVTIPRLLLSVLIAFQATAAVRPGTTVLIACSSNLPAYEEAVGGIRTALNGSGAAIVVVELDGDGSAEQLAQQLSREPAVAVAIGSPALEALIAARTKIPVIATMTLGPLTASAGRLVTAVTLDVAPATVLVRLREIYPRRNRVAVIRGPGLSAAAVREVQEQGRQFGYEIQIVDCPSPKVLLDQVGVLRGRVDFIWLFPDATLYPSPVVSALILSGIRNGLGLIGFSEGLVEAGSLVGFYPDYRDVGAQAGESVLQHLEGQPVAALQRPRKVKAAVNERVMRVLGATYSPNASKGLSILR